MCDSAAIQAVTDLIYTFNSIAPSLACHATLQHGKFVALSLESYNTSAEVRFTIACLLASGMAVNIADSSTAGEHASPIALSRYPHIYNLASTNMS